VVFFSRPIGRADALGAVLAIAAIYLGSTAKQSMGPAKG